MQDVYEKLGITVEWKAKMLKKCAERCMPEDEGKRIRPTGMISAISELNKMQGDYEPTKTEITADVTAREDIKRAREIAMEKING